MTAIYERSGQLRIHVERATQVTHTTDRTPGPKQQSAVEHNRAAADAYAWAGDYASADLAAATAVADAADAQLTIHDTNSMMVWLGGVWGRAACTPASAAVVEFIG